MKLFQKNRLRNIKKIVPSDFFLIYGIFIFTVASIIHGIYHTGAQNNIEKLRSGMAYLIEVRGITDSAYSDSQISNVFGPENGFSRKAYVNYLELARIMHKSPESPKKLDEIKTHSDLEEAVEKDVIYSYNYYLADISIKKQLYEDESKIHFKYLIIFQYIIAFFSFVLAIKQIDLKRK